MARPKKFYAVAKGVTPGIYTTWFGPDGAEVQVKGVKGARYKGFASLAEAQQWLKQPHSGNTTPAAQPKRGAPPPDRDMPESGIVVFTDGSALNNPGPGGYGVVIEKNGKRIRELSGGFCKTTNNRMELMACIMALRQFPKKSTLTLYTDSRYVVDGITKNWARGWRSRGWKKSNGENALNPDLWGALLELVSRHNVTFRWVKGHAGNPGNERCDELANTAAQQPGLLPDKGYPSGS